MSDKNRILILHDRADLGPSLAGFLKNQGYAVTHLARPSACLKHVSIRDLSRYDVVILHKDLGQEFPDEWNLGIDSGVIIDTVHERASYLRVGVVSGEYPDGTKHVLEMGADYYCNPMDLNTDWGYAQLDRGWTSPDEQDLRGFTVEMPSGTHGKEALRW